MKNKLTFNDLLKKVRKDDLNQIPGFILAIDPGHTTGWSLFINNKLALQGQIDTVINRKGNNEGTIDKKAVDRLMNIITNVTLHISMSELQHLSNKRRIVVCEDYRVYAHKLKRHTNSQVLTLRIIGMIEYICYLYGIPLVYQSASMAKGFADDTKLKMWDFYIKGKRHSRDSIRHAIYFMLFNKDIINK